MTGLERPPLQQNCGRESDGETQSERVSPETVTVGSAVPAVEGQACLGLMPTVPEKGRGVEGHHGNPSKRCNSELRTEINL